MSDVSAGFGIRRTAVTHVLLDRIGADDLHVDLPDDVEHHLRSVLRVGDGALVTVTDGQGAWRPTRAVVDRTSVRLAPDGPLTTEDRREPPLVVAAAIPKGDRVEVMVQKATELGVDVLVLLHADRSVVRWKPERAERNLARLQRIADEATRQSRRVWRTSVVGPLRALDVISGGVSVTGSSGSVVGGPEGSRPMAIAEPGGRPMTPDDRRIAVGPEGGWSDAELSATTERVGIGENILRIETAVLAVTTLSVVSNH